jgi:prepilin-type N-terminal cleavage/methylation domain-containing protein
MYYTTFGMGNNRGVNLVEILIAIIILSLVVAGTTATYISIKKISNAIGYSFTACNLAKEILEYGEAQPLREGVRMKYYFSVPTACTIPAADGGCSSRMGCSISGGLDTTTPEGYALREWQDFCPTTSRSPFVDLGDIKAKGLVPKGTPDSVSIYFVIDHYPGATFGDAFRETVEINWFDDVTAAQESLVVSVVPIRQMSNRLKLNIERFWWD